MRPAWRFRRHAGSGCIRSNYGASADADLGDAFWLVDSESNRHLAQKAFSAGATSPNSAVFRRGADTPLDEEVFTRFEDADLHHPNWTEIAFFGAFLTPEL